jgi:hypothetical protein
LVNNTFSLRQDKIRQNTYLNASPNVGLDALLKSQDRQSQEKSKARQDKTRQDKTRQDKTRQDKTRQDKTRQDKSRPFRPLETCTYE